MEESKDLNMDIRTYIKQRQAHLSEKESHYVAESRKDTLTSSEKEAMFNISSEYRSRIHELDLLRKSLDSGNVNSAQGSDL